MTSFISSRQICLIAAAALPLLAQTSLAEALPPADASDIVHGDIQTADSVETRTQALDLLQRARYSYTLRSAAVAYELKTSFTVNSGGATQFDGAWQMEDTYDPAQGLHWTASNGNAYSITEITSKGRSFVDSTLNYIPLRLHEARAALFGPIPSPEAVQNDTIRTAPAVYQGVAVTCVLLSPLGPSTANTAGRSWEETEECIDPQTGLLMLHSLVPGHYDGYDYSDAPQLAGHIFPRKVTITEAGKAVSEISVDTLEPISAGHASLFVPTAQMKEHGRATLLAGAQKIAIAVPLDTQASGAMAHVICVFGLLTASGDFIDLHSLQPADPYSQAALQAAKQMTFRIPPRPGQLKAPPQQHFVFVIAKVG